MPGLTTGHVQFIDRNSTARLWVARLIGRFNKEKARQFYARRVFVKIGTKEMAVYP